MTDLQDPAALPSPPALSAGGRLRRERETRGLSIADVASHLKVGPKRVEAMEAEDWHSLLPLPYLRGFIRNYAKLVQIDAELLLAEIDSALGRVKDTPPPSLQPAPQLDMPFFDRHASRSGYRRVVLIVLGIVALLLVGMVVVWVGGGGVARTVEQARAWFGDTHGADATVRQAEPVAPVPAQTQAMPRAPEPAELQPRTDEGRVEQALPVPISDIPARRSWFNSVTATEAVPTESAGPNAIVLSFAGESWVEARQGDGKILMSQLNFPNTEKVLRGREPIEFIIGNAKAVRLSYRGVPVDLTPHMRENVAHVTLK